MALDVHLVNAGSEDFSGWPTCQFDASRHDAVFFSGVLDIKRYPLLLRMADYYADARYSTDEVRQLLDELAEVIPVFRDQPTVHAAWTAFQNACQEAVSRGKDVVCLCD